MDRLTPKFTPLAILAFVGSILLQAMFGNRILLREVPQSMGHSSQKRYELVPRTYITVLFVASVQILNL